MTGGVVHPWPGRASAVVSPPARLLYWCDTTRAQPFETGIQRVTRRLAHGLERCGVVPVPIGWDPERLVVTSLAPQRPEPPPGVAAFPPAATMSALERAGGAWLLVPEIPMAPLAVDVDPVQLARSHGLRSAAIVHDLIPLRLPEHYSSAETAMYRRYYRMFAGADIVFATTELVAGHLREHLSAEGLRVPPIAVVPLPGQFADLPRAVTPPTPRRADEPLRLLTVSTWERRKNLPRLLRAVRMAEAEGGAPITLTLVGRSGHDPALYAELVVLMASMARVKVHARLGDAELAELYAAHDASVYPSCEEGFGLPVLESLWLGRGCVCHAGSALAEVAPGGGTVQVDMVDEGALAAGLVRLAREPGLLDRLTGEALTRPLRTWADYAGAVAEWLAPSPPQAP